MQPAGDPANGPTAGFVLAGGGSRRMGSDKALLPLDGGSLIGHIAACVRESAGVVHLVGAPETYRSLQLPMIPDLYPASGPVGGIVTALAASTAEWNLIVACDMPGLTVPFLTGLLIEARASKASCTLPVTPEGRSHPMCAVYRRSAVIPLQRALEAGERKLHTALKAIRVHVYPVVEIGPLANVNTPDEWRSFQQDAAR